MDKDIKPQNIKFYCRTCLNQLTACKYDIEEMPNTMFQLLKQLTNYKKNLKDYYPNSICIQCYETFKTFDEFQETSKKSAQYLEDLLKPYIKSLKATKDKKEESQKCDEIEDFQSSLDNEEKVADPLSSIQQEDINSPKSVVKVEHTPENDNVLEMIVEPSIADLQTDEISQRPKRTPRRIGPNLTCDICQKTYATSSSLSMHKRLHKADHSFKCEQCDRGFNKRYRLTNHLRAIHGIVVPVNESKKKDSKSSKKKSQNADNITEGTGIKMEIEKNLSEESNTDDDNVKTENKTDNVNQSTGTTQQEIDLSIIKKMCKVCHKTFKKVDGLRLHMRLHEETPRFPCDKCDKGFRKRFLLKRHKDEDHAENPVEIVCKYGCGMVFQRHAASTAHYRREHKPAKEKKPNTYSCICEQCGKVCANSWSLREHYYQHVPLEESPYQCEQCSKRFRTKKHLQHHVLRHAGVKKFECSVCGMKKYTPHELRVHMNYHTREIQHYCSFCNKAFNNAANKRLHEQVVHQRIKKFNCRFCDESFGKPATLKHHEMRHTGERPHKCSYCERSFIQAVALKKHLNCHLKSQDKTRKSLKVEQNLIELNMNEAVNLLGAGSSQVLNLNE